MVPVDDSRNRKYTAAAGGSATMQHPLGVSAGQQLCAERYAVLGFAAPLSGQLELLDRQEPGWIQDYRRLEKTKTKKYAYFCN